MKNKFVFLTAAAILFVSVLGCSYFNPLEGSSNVASNDNRTMSDKAIDSTIGEKKLGIPECDEIFDFFAEQARSQEDDFITKAAREYALNTIRESLKQSLEEHKGDKTAMAKDCRNFKTEIDKFKAQDSNTQKN